MSVIYLYSPQDQYANSLMHDANMTFRVPLHRMVGAAAIISMCTFRLGFEGTVVEEALR